MTTAIHKIILFIGLLLWVTPTFAAQGEADFKKLSKTYTLQANGAWELRVQKELTLNTHLAMNSLYGETFIVYNPSYQHIEFRTAYTTQADGNRIDVPQNAFNEVLPRAAADAPAYNHLREMVVTHTGLELGATIYLDYTLFTKPGYSPALDINEVLQELSPIREYTVTVNIPQGTPFTYAPQGNAFKPTVQTTKGITCYQWKAKHIPAANKEPLQPTCNTTTRRVIASTYATPEAALATWGKQLPSLGTLSAEASTFVQQWVQHATTTADKTKAIHAYVLSQVATSAVSPEEAGYTFRPATEVLRTGYGTALEKSVLLIAMLQTINQPATLVAAYPANTVCGLNTIRHFAVQAADAYLSPTSTTCTINSQGELYTVWTITPQACTIKATTATPRSQVQTDTITACQVSALPYSNGYAVLALNSKSEVDNWRITPLNSVRTQVLELPYLLNETQTRTIMLPTGVTLQTLPNETTIANSVGSLQISIRQQENEVTVTRHLTLTKQQIPPSAYNEFRTLIHTWVDKNTDSILLEKK